MAIAPVLKTGGPKGPCRFESYALRSFGSNASGNAGLACAGPAWGSGRVL